ncbi:hypothetical protein Tco_1091762 [Tanacetum coccineum]|uniref:Tf2-1-like SH3-like domain-containing protein n=1 Tax=Tanacetum coccineum TaxID=301880 RepID=A0ABQ5I971_9ASTR
MQVAGDRQKSYADLKHKPMEFQVGDKVMLKVSPWKGVIRFSKRGKLNPRYVGPFKVLEKVRYVAYKLELPEELSRVHNMFHVSNLEKCYADEPLAVPLDGLHFDDKLQFVEETVAFRHLRDAFSVVFGLSLTQDTIMLDSEDSMVTYTAVSSPFMDLPDIGSPGVDGPPVMPEDLYAYVPVYPEFMPLEDEILPAEEQPLPVAVSPTADSPGYVPESDHEEDPKEDNDEDLVEDPTDYPTDGGDDGDDEDESSDDDEDEDVDIKGDEEYEEHPAPADSTIVALPTVDHAPSTKETEPFKTDESAATPPPHPAYQVTARISIRDEPPTPFWSDTEVSRLLAIPTPPPSPLSLWSSPLPQIPSPPLPPILSPLLVSPPLPVLSPPPASPICTPPSGTPPSRTPPLLPIPLPTSSPPFHLLSTDCRADRPEVTLPPQKRLGIALSLRYEVGESSSAPTARPPRCFRADYDFVATIDREIMRDLERDVELGRWMKKFTTRVRQDTDEIYTRLDDEQSERQLMAGRFNMMYRDRRAHACTARLMEAEARITTGSDYRVTELQAADRRRQVATTELLAADRKR